VFELLGEAVGDPLVADVSSQFLDRAVMEGFDASGRGAMRGPSVSRVLFAGGWCVPRANARRGRYEILARHKRELLDLLGRGHSDNEMAGLLHISERTLEDHRAPRPSTNYRGEAALAC
jgi:DNA-binding NarL/FixJ family response regulator